MKVLILAAGRSRRAKPIEDKNFLKFCGHFLIDCQLHTLKQAGFSDFIIAGGAHNLKQLTDVSAEYGTKVIEQKDLEEGMAGAILAAESEIGEEDLFIVSSNDVVDHEAYQAIHDAIKSDSDSYLLAYKIDKYFPGGYLKLEGNKITSIVEKPGEGNEPSDLVNLVLHYHKNPKALFDKLKENNSDKDDRYEVALDKLMKERHFEAVSYDGFWQPIKYPWQVLDVMDHYLPLCQPEIDASVEIADSASIKGHVSIGKGTKILENAVIIGPAYIGENCIIATNALVRSSSIGDNCVVGYSTEIARSHIGDDCWFHSNYVGDTVMGNNNSFGAGAICTNLRLDEKEIGESGRTKLGPMLGDNIRIGVQTSLMPGIKIGSNTMITSGLTISEDIEPGKFVHGKTELTIKDNKAALDPDARSSMKKKL